MRKSEKRTWLGTTLWCALAAGAAAQEVDPGTPMQWTGRTAEGGAAFRPDEGFAQEITREAAGAELAAETGRDFEGALSALSELRARASFAGGFPDQGEALVQVALSRARLLLALGRFDAAREATRELLPRAGEVAEGLGLELEPAGERLLALEASLAEHEDLVRRRGRIDAAARDPRDGGRGSASPPDAVALVRYVEERFGPFSELVAHGVEEALCDSREPPALGPRMASALAFLVLAELEGLREPCGGPDPLLLLLDVDEVGGTRLVADHLDAGGTEWRLRLLAALEAGAHLADVDAWSYSEGTGKVEPRSPEWLAVLEMLLADPVTFERVLGEVVTVLRYDALTPAMVDALAAGLASDDARRAERVVATLRTVPAVESARPLYRAALEHADPGIRRFGAAMLASFEDTAPLLAAVDDPDAGVRREVASGLGERKAQRVRYDSVGSRPTWKRYRRSLGAAEWTPAVREAFAAFARDEDVRVRVAAAESLAELSGPRDLEPYRPFLEDPDPSVRIQLAEVSTSDAALRAQVLERLAADPEADVAHAVDAVLEEHDWLDPSEGMFDVVDARLRHPRFPLEGWSRWDGPGEFIKFLADRVARTRAGELVVVAWIAESGSVTHLSLLRHQRSWQIVAEHASELAAEVFARLFVNATHVSGSLFEALLPVERLPVDGLLRVVEDEDAPFRARLEAAVLATQAERAAFEPVAAFLQGPAWEGRRLTGDELAALVKLRLPSGRSNQLLAEWMADERFPDQALRVLAAAFEPTEPGGEELARAIVARWVGASDVHGRLHAVEAALATLRRFPSEATRRALATAAREGVAYTSAVVDIIADLRDPELAGALATILGQASVHPQYHRRKAARALGSLPGGGAVEILLDAFEEERDPVVREVIREALEHIEASRRLRDEWAQRSLVGESRDAVVAEVLAALESDSELVRAHAARSLGALGALEAIPRLLRLLEDESSRVVEAAGSALERLQGLDEEPADAPPEEPGEDPE